MAELDPKKDFEADKLLSHDKDIPSLGDRVGAIEQKLTAIDQKLTNPEQIALIFEAASKDSKRLDGLLSHTFCNMLKNDESVKAAVQEKIKTIDRDAVRALLKKFGGLAGFAIWSIALAAIAAWLGHIWK